MPLYSLDNVKQSPVGRQEHWKLFEAFQDTALHAPIAAETYYEEPLFLPVADVRAWKRHLVARTKAVLRHDPSVEPPNPQFGCWRSLA